METIKSVTKARHSLSSCPCGHAEHVARGFRQIDRIMCLECVDIEADEAVTIAIETVARVAALPISRGMIVRCAGQTCRVVDLEVITKLDGHYRTGYMRVKLKEHQP